MDDRVRLFKFPKFLTRAKKLSSAYVAVDKTPLCFTRTVQAVWSYPSDRTKSHNHPADNVLAFILIGLMIILMIEYTD